MILQLQNFTSLELQGSDGKDGNPGNALSTTGWRLESLLTKNHYWLGCNHPAYSAIISRCLPNLLILDGKSYTSGIRALVDKFVCNAGGLIGVADASAQVAKALADIKPQALNEDDYKVKSWIDESFAETPETVFPQSIEETMDAIRDMLKVESSHLLRQSNAVLNKTKSWIFHKKLLYVCIDLVAH